MSVLSLVCCLTVFTCAELVIILSAYALFCQYALSETYPAHVFIKFHSRFPCSEEFSSSKPSPVSLIYDYGLSLIDLACLHFAQLYIDLRKHIPSFTQSCFASNQVTLSFL